MHLINKQLRDFSLDDSLSATLLSILCASSVPLSTRELGARLRSHGVRLPDHEVGSLLRNLLTEGKVNFRIGRWSTSDRSGTVPVLSPKSLPPLSGETLSILGLKSPAPPVTPPSGGTIHPAAENDDTDAEMYTGRWGTFRRLLAYYRQCIRQEEGADARAFQNEMGKRFIYLRRIGHWHPRPGVCWQTIIPLGPHLSPLLNALPGNSDDQPLVIGYPVHAFYKEKEGEPDVSVIRPIFFFAVETRIAPNGLVVICEDPRPEVNLGWLDFAFSSNLERQRGFLSACGFLNREKPIDEPLGFEGIERVPGLESLVAALSAFMPEKIREPLLMCSVPEDPLREPFSNGIYNRSVLMVARRTKYTATLLKELVAIERTQDEVLDRTALSHIFTGNREQKTHEELLHEAIITDTAPLNAEQRLASASLLVRDLTVVTGPPGTGKSQVVSSTIANARLQGQTVLFASRNHKAIDAVIGRLSDPDGRPLIVRTNSKDDPGLNYTFSDAIRDMLAARPCPESIARLQRAREELSSLLQERGRKADFARRTAEIAEALGNLEERRSYLAQELPGEMVHSIDTKPEQFPRKALHKTLQVIQRLQLRGRDGNLSQGFQNLFRLWMALPRYRLTRRALRRIPGSPKLPALPRESGLKALLLELSVLDKALEYTRLSIECRDYENKLAELPELEATTAAVSDLSSRIRDVALRAIPLDLDVRCNLDDQVNRAELDGLRAALNAMRTGLDEGTIRQETIRVLEERARHIINAFPCWAVTNLSAGSRIPLIAGLYDLAIVDEASQSDIPSAIPILFRARRAGVVGDPCQLSHASRLTTARDTMLRRSAGLKRVEDVRFAYTESSLYDLFAGTNGVEPVFLSETYRSAEEIAEYSSRAFYNGRLRVATDESRLKVPRGMPTGIHWTEVSGEIRSAGGSGCTCREEVDAVVSLMRTMILENNFIGTAGVVTPFRQQANRLRDALFESDSLLYEALIRCSVHVDTAHGFQGDERDVIVFSLCAGPGMPAGSRTFLRETGNLFNVAVSRARAILHVVGNREWAKSCGIRHIENLALTRERSSGTPQQGPWHPHESPWEQKLYRAMVEAGLDPRPQFPVGGRRLDLALVRQGDAPLKIDIEVDGDCHRNPDGTRKMDDHWRDIQLQGMGWKVIRFWTYMLREDMGACIEKIRKAWSER